MRIISQLSFSLATGYVVFQKNFPTIQRDVNLHMQTINWIIESVLSKSDAKKRANVVKYFINVAEVSQSLPILLCIRILRDSPITPAMSGYAELLFNCGDSFCAEQPCCQTPETYLGASRLPCVQSIQQLRNHYGPGPQLSQLLVSFEGRYPSRNSFLRYDVSILSLRHSQLIYPPPPI